MAKKFYRTEIQIVVLSEDTPPTENWGLECIISEFRQGDFSGEWKIVDTQELTPAEAAKALITQGSDPEFFGLNEDGTPLDEEDDQEQLEAAVKDAVDKQQ